MLPGAARAVGWKGKSGFAGTRLHGAPRARRKLGGSRFGGEKGEALGPQRPEAAGLAAEIIWSMFRC